MLLNGVHKPKLISALFDTLGPMSPGVDLD